MVTDEQLLANYSHGDQCVFSELMGRYKQELFAFLYRFVSDAAAAEDLFQETFIQVHRNAGSFDPQRRFRPWLFTIAANKGRDYLRSSGRHFAQSLDNSARGERGGRCDGFRRPDGLRARRPRRPISSRPRTSQPSGEVLASLPDHYREVLVMSYFHQFAYKEMAEMLHIPLGTVKSRLHAALAIFAKSFQDKHP